MIIALRGHIRESFNSDKLYNLFCYIVNKYPETKIYIHTWNIVQTDASWRPMGRDETVVTEEFIKNYFKKISNNIAHIIIEDDSKIELHSKKPLKIFWKRYLYGKSTLLNLIKERESDDSLVLTARFDIMDNTVCPTLYHIESWISNSEKRFRKNTNKLYFLLPSLGCDNIYMGSVDNMHKLISNNYYNADRIIRTYPLREYSFIKEATKLFGKKNVVHPPGIIYTVIAFSGGFNKLVKNSLSKQYNFCAANKKRKDMKIPKSA